MEIPPDRRDDVRRVQRNLCVGWFAILGTLAFQGRFMSLFFKDRGYSNTQIGVILSLNPLFSTFSAPMFSYAADKMGYRKIFILLISASILFVNGYKIASSVLQSDEAKFVAYLIIYSLFSAAFMPLSAIYDAATVALLEDVNVKSSSYGHSRVWGAIGWGIVNAALIGPIMDLTGSTWWLVWGYTASAVLTLSVFMFIFARGTEDVLATVAPTVGPGVDTVQEIEFGALAVDASSARNSDDDNVTTTGDDNSPRISDIGNTKIPTSDNSRDGYSVLKTDETTAIVCERKSKPRSQLSDLRLLFHHEDGVSICWTTVSFFALVLALGIGTTLVEGLVFLYFSEDLNASSALCGVSVLVTIVFELPLFYYSDTILERANVHVLNTVAVVSFCVRVVVYTILPSPWLVLLVEPLHGVTYACHKLACMEYISAISSRAPGLETTAQGLRSASANVGSFIGAAFGGLVMDSYGANAMYRGSSVVVLLVCSIYIAVVRSSASH